MSWKETKDEFQSFHFITLTAILGFRFLRDVSSLWAFLSLAPLLAPPPHPVHPFLLPSSFAFSILPLPLSVSLRLAAIFRWLSLYTLYCQIPLLACVPLAWGRVRSQPWQDLWRAVVPGRPIWLAADWVGCSKSITGRGRKRERGGAKRIDCMTTNSLGCEANVIPALFIPDSIRISSKWPALWTTVSVFWGLCKLK